MSSVDRTRLHSLLHRPLFIKFSLLTTKQIISPATSTREMSWHVILIFRIILISKKGLSKCVFSGVAVGTRRFSFLMVRWVDVLFWFLELYWFQKGAIKVDYRLQCVKRVRMELLVQVVSWFPLAVYLPQAITGSSTSFSKVSQRTLSCFAHWPVSVYKIWDLEIVSQNNHWTYTRFFCTHLNVFYTFKFPYGLTSRIPYHFLLRLGLELGLGLGSGIRVRD